MNAKIIHNNGVNSKAQALIIFIRSFGTRVQMHNVKTATKPTCSTFSRQFGRWGFVSLSLSLYLCICFFVMEKRKLYRNVKSTGYNPLPPAEEYQAQRHDLISRPRKQDANIGMA